MGSPAATEGSMIEALDTHLEQPPGPVSPVPVETPFTGIIDAGTSADVLINDKPAATLGSMATNEPPHIPTLGPFVDPPTNEGEIITGSLTVLINDKPAARAGDTCLTCNDPVPLPIGEVVAESNVLIGG